MTDILKPRNPGATSWSKATDVKRNHLSRQVGLCNNPNLSNEPLTVAEETLRHSDINFECRNSGRGTRRNGLLLSHKILFTLKKLFIFVAPLKFVYSSIKVSDVLVLTVCCKLFNFVSQIFLKCLLRFLQFSD
jgi:hypothetical protein